MYCFWYFITDVDECATSNGGCHANAGCTNNIGKPRTCKCKLGFSGDGITCGGMYSYFMLIYMCLKYFSVFETVTFI